MAKRRCREKVTVRYADGRVEERDPRSFRKRPYWRSPQWKAKCRAVLERDGHRCVSCKRSAGATDPRLKAGKVTRLQVHHLTYERYGYERLDDLVTLCERCHSTEHAWQRRLADPAPTDLQRSSAFPGVPNVTDTKAMIRRPLP